MLKALHVTPSMWSEWGGPTVVVSELTSELYRQGVSCEIVTTRGYRTGDKPVSTPDIPLHCFDTELPARLWAAYSRKLSRFLHREAGRFDIIHIHGVWSYVCYAAFYAARRHGVPCVLTVHGELTEWGLRRNALRKQLFRLALTNKVLRQANALHAITDAESAQLLRIGCQAPVHVIPNGIDSAAFAALPDATALLARYPALQGKRIILFLGRLHPKKGLDILAHSFDHVVRRFDDAVLLIAGPDKIGTRAQITAILRDKGLLDKAVFTGHLHGQDKLAALHCAELFVLPSHSDVLGISTLEAMAARLPVVITHGCEFPEVAEQEAGFVVEAGEQPIADSICALLADPARGQRMGQQGRKLVSERYTWQTSARAMHDLYKMSGK